MTLPDLIRRWQYGWGLAKGLVPAQDISGSDGHVWALKVTLDLPGRFQEFLPLEAAHARYFAGVVARAAQPSWVSVVGPGPVTALVDFKAAGLVQIGTDDSLMSIPLADHPDQDAPEGYTVDIAVTDPASHKRTLGGNSSWDGTTLGGTAGNGSAADAPAGGDAAEDRSAAEPGGDDAVIRVRVVDADGQLAARGLMGVHGTDAVAHGIETDPAHRRRGLGSVVMSALSRKAIELGADTGLLVAVPEGQYLYTKLGWRDEATFVTGALPPD